jgi:geranylgeranyl diphosphate synthase type I
MDATLKESARRECIETSMQAVLAGARHEQAAELDAMLSYHMGWTGEGAGAAVQGKRIRPQVVLMAAEAVGGDWQTALPAAAAVELLHNFSLIHDDIQDNSPLRRGRPTVWNIWGIPQAINAGDCMFTLAFRAMHGLSETVSAQTALRAVQMLEQTCIELTRGQYLDISFEDRSEVSLDEYWTMIEGKTAALLAACLELGALAGGASQDTVELYGTFGRKLGLAFQVQDDLLGVWGAAELTGKSIKGDILNGKKSLPILYGLTQKGAFATRWHQGPIEPDEVEALAAALEAEDARAYTEAAAEKLTVDALQALEQADPQGQAGQDLADLANRLLKRKF